MPFVPSFSASQSLSNLEDATFLDDSTGSDGAITYRTITITEANGTKLADEQIWLLANTSITLSILDRDYALQVVVKWKDVNDATLYTKSLPIVFTGYGQTFLYNKAQSQAAMSPSIINDTDYFNNLSKLQTLIDSAIQANSLASDIFTAQYCLDASFYMMQNENYLF